MVGPSREGYHACPAFTQAFLFRGIYIFLFPLSRFFYYRGVVEILQGDSLNIVELIILKHLHHVRRSSSGFSGSHNTDSFPHHLCPIVLEHVVLIWRGLHTLSSLSHDLR